jgi:hypothetical protein
MSENKKQEPKQKSKININIKGIDINKAEYQQIVLSHTNFPDKSYSKSNNSY